MMFSSIMGRKTNVFLFALMFLLSSCNNFQDIVSPIPITATQAPTSTTTPTEMVTTATKELPEQKIEYIKLIDQIGHGVILDIAWHPSGSEIAVATNAGIHFYSPDSLVEEDYWMTAESTTSLVYKSDGTLISGSQSGTLIYWDHEGNNTKFLSKLESVCSLVLSPDEQWLAMASCNQWRDGKQDIAIWNTGNQSLLGLLQTQERKPVGITFSPKSELVSIHELGNGVCNWEIPSLQLIESCKKSFCDGLPCGPQHVISSRDSTRIAYVEPFGGIDDKYWNAEERRLLPTRRCDTCYSYGAWYSPDTKYLVAGANDMIFVFDVATGEVIAQNSYELAKKFAFSPDGDKFVTYNYDNLNLFETKTAKKLVDSSYDWGTITALAISPDHSRFVSAYDSGVIKFWGFNPIAYQHTLQIDLRVRELTYVSGGQLVFFNGSPRNQPSHFDLSFYGVIRTESGAILSKIEHHELSPRRDEPLEKISPDGRVMVSHEIRNEVDTIIITTPQSGKELGQFQSNSYWTEYIEIILHEDKYWVFVGGSDGLINIWAVKIVEN